MMKNKTYFSIYLVVIIGLLSCSDDNDDFGFIDQELTGKIGGQEYTAFEEGGSAEEWIFDRNQTDVTIGGPSISDACQYEYEGLRVSFIILREAGIYQLDDDQDTDMSADQVLVYLHPAGDSSLDNFTILSKGVIEILTVDNMGITGRINARLDDSNFVNGNFSVPFCQQ